MKRKYISKQNVRFNKGVDKANFLFSVLGIIIGVASAILLLVITAFIIKDMHLDDGAISVLSTVIKILAAGVCTYFTIKRVNIHPFIIAPITCGSYMLFSSVLFFILSQNKYFDLRVFFVDVLIGIAAGTLFSIILGKKSLYLKKK